MYSWDLTIAVRKRVCELRLWFLYDAYGNVINERRRCPECGPSWHKKNDKLAAIHHEMKREMAEIRFLRTLLRQGPLGGLRVVLHNQDTHRVEPGPRIIDIIEREIENAKAATGWADTDWGKGIIEGLERAYQVYLNPYLWLTETEKPKFKDAEDAREQIISGRAGRAPTSAGIGPGGKSGPAGPTPDQRAAATVVRRGTY